MKILSQSNKSRSAMRPSASPQTGKWIEEADLQFAMNEPDAYALEEALQLKEKNGGEVIVLSAGPERVGTTIREALAKGADRAIHVQLRRPRLRATLSALRTARRSHQARKSRPGPHRTAVRRPGPGPDRRHCRRTARPAPLPRSSCTSKRPTRASKLNANLKRAGSRTIELPLPAVLTIQSGGNKLRYATLMGIKRAKTKEVRVVAAADLGPAAAPVRYARTNLPARKTKIHADPSRLGQRSRGSAGRKTQVRGAGAMSGVLLVLGRPRRQISRVSWEAAAAAQRLARMPAQA